ncbi:acyl-CoA desaturase [Pseudonocardia endophytica]|uniref:Stearoyl-CoA desaturase (Delta-9 desaturase) n=1 Tax=Pseudonocardia endophytica TaxID=401976 RepID=A0A4R1HJE1_PSEEN|nr:acyl-CoA desaturase [Pseudonocardia endophytica]TCK20615.1 stearoyl-CoA desaturase (delta-9 desaturase) [Pseudonocardia endophytica]
MTIEAAPPAPAPPKSGPAPVTEGIRPTGAAVLVGVFVTVPMLALIAAVPFAWGWGLTGLDIALAVVFYLISGLGVTVGFHRYFTHGSFKANRPLRIALAVAGSVALQGGVLDWTGDHRRHHAFSDKEGDPHSPWLYGTGPAALAKGFWHSHMGWLFDRDLTNRKRFIPDLLADKDMVKIQKLFPWLVVASLLGPALIGGLVTMSFWGAFTAFFWAGLVRVAFLHHVTWSINSICHIWGERPFAARDRSANVWWLAVFSFGESWHNLHHADPTCARHGVKRGQIDISAMLIRGFERLGWATNVRWPTTRRLEKLSKAA